MILKHAIKYLELTPTLKKGKCWTFSGNDAGGGRGVYFEINFKTDNEELPYLYARFVDLPGFGYAKVSKSIKAEWNRNLTAYLEQRQCLQIFVHLIDSRHPLLDIDKNVDEFLRTIKRGDQIIIQAFTKIDKLKMNDLAKLKREYPEGIFISNLKKKGMIDLQNKITGYLFGH